MPARTGTSIRRQATGLTPDLGAARVLLLGYDMWVHGGHILWIGDAPTNTKPVILEHLTLPGFKALAVSRHDRRAAFRRCHFRSTSSSRALASFGPSRRALFDRG